MSVRKRGKSWLVTVELGRDEYGRRRRHCSTHATERLGHSSVKITLDRYSHVIPDLQTEAAEKTDILLRGIMPDAVT